MSENHLLPPAANLTLLQGTSINKSQPMVFAALGNFKPLSDFQLQEREFGQSKATINNYKEISKTIANELIQNEKNFILTIDEAFLQKHPAINLADCENFIIRTTLPNLHLTQNNKFFLTISNSQHFTIEGIITSSGRNIFYIGNSSSFTVQDCSSSSAEGCCIIIRNGYDFRVNNCQFRDNLSTCILLLGTSHRGAIKDCMCTNSRGFFNHDAAIHLCHTSPEVTIDHIPEKYHEPLPYSAKTKRPHHIVIENCVLANNRAQGIYLEGAINCLIRNNILINNNKEGICFDWGSSYNIFCNNIVTLNGERRNLSPQEIKIDFITEYPLLKDGSSSMKLPGISLDNGCMNLICDNKVSNNYGGGIKMIRTALFNDIRNNQVLFNAIGANSHVPYFHGITALGLGAQKNEFSSTRKHNLDFIPSILNSITQNIIKEEQVAIFFDKKSENNFLSSNVVEPREQTNKFYSLFKRTSAYLRRRAHQFVN